MRPHICACCCEGAIASVHTCVCVCAFLAAPCAQGAAGRGGPPASKGSSLSPGRPLNISGDGGASGRSGGGGQQASREAAGTSSLLGGTRVSCRAAFVVTLEELERMCWSEVPVDSWGWSAWLNQLH